MTISSAAGSSSIFTSRNSTPRSFRNVFARRQSGHHGAPYIVRVSMGRSAYIRCWRAYGVANARTAFASGKGEPASAGFDRNAAILARDLDANEGALQRDGGAV